MFKDLKTQLFASSMAAIVLLLLAVWFITRAIYTPAIIIIVLMCIFLVGVNLWFSSRVSEPIAKLSDHARRIAEGTYGIKLEKERDDELGVLTEEINDMSEKVAIAEKSRTEFISQVSHELRTPMTTIAGFIDGILDGTIPAEKRDYYLKIVSDEIKRLSRLVKTMLWMKGGYKIYVRGDARIYDYLCSVYCAGGVREFDWDYMANVFERPFEVVQTDTLPAAKDSPKAIGGHMDGCRIGFDAGGSDRKVSAVINGEAVYSEEVVWFPKINSDPDYHYAGIVAALKSAAEHMPRVDAVGVSSAGIYINNRTMNASLFLKVPKEQFDAKVKDIYIRAITDTFGNVPYSVVNDGDVTALAGAMSLQDGCVMGLAMGTSEAAGYIDRNGDLLGWFNELAFAPVDLSETAAVDEWSGDRGVGCKYFSQDAVIRLAAAAGVPTDAALTPAQQLQQVQELARQGHPAARRIFRDMGVCLAHTLALYAAIYPLCHVMVLGRVASGIGGEWMTETCRRVLAEEYPQLPLEVLLPDDRFRRIGQSVAAASLPQVRP